MMKELNILSREESPTPGQIKELETVVSSKLPEDLKQFLQSFNPKQTVERLITKNDNEYVIYNWLPLSSKADISIQNTFEWTKELLLGRYLAFALDAGDWLFVISINKEDYGKVFFCRPDYELRDGLTLLANTFTEFLNGLEPYGN
jgi:hypothetical protein